jgi:apolipoprotein N-acyltransferase
MSRFLRINLSLLSAAILSEAIINHSFLIWIALIPILLAMRGEIYRYKVLYGMLCGSFVSIYIFSPVLAYGTGYLLAFAIYCGLVGIIIVGLAEYLRENSSTISRIFIFPIVWVSFEYLSSKGLISFPMTLAIALHDNLSLLQIVSITGSSGLSFMIIAANLILFEWIIFFMRRESLKVLLGVSVLYLSVLSAVFLWGLNEVPGLPGPENHSVEVAVIQGSIPRWMYVLEKKNKAYRKKMQDLYFGLTEKANKEREPDIIVWPEAVVNQRMLEIPALKKRILGMTKKYNNTMIIGVPHIDEEKNYYNAAFIITEPDGFIEKYKKIKLLPWVEPYFSGKRQGVFDIAYGKIGVLICFESIYPAMSRTLVKKGADVIFILTNDAGFNKTHLPELHAREAILRAVENRCQIVRAAQSGISMFIDRFGRVRRKTELFSSTIMYHNIDFSKKGGSVYSQRGDIFVYICAFFIFLNIVRRVKRR